MVKIFAKGAAAVVPMDTAYVDDIPALREPKVESIGIDINLPLLVKEVGTRQLEKLRQRRVQLLAELERNDRETAQLVTLVAAAESPTKI
jgi:hypothetical protein